MITSAEVEGTILGALAALNLERSTTDQIAVSIQTQLFGEGSQLDSLQLVSLITDVEVELNGKHGLDLSLADERAMERPESPYTTGETLRDYILELTQAP